MQEIKCQYSGKLFKVTDLEEGLVERFKFPEPIISPEERLRRNLSFFPSYRFYTQNISPNQNQATVYNTLTKFNVVPQSVWQESAEKFFASGLEYQISENPIDKFKELLTLVSRPHLLEESSNNSDKIFNGIHCSDSEWAFNSRNIKDCEYSFLVDSCYDCLDCNFVSDLDHCYMVTNSLRCNGLKFSDNCSDCNDSWFLQNCYQCENCIACCNLEGKSYYYFNNPVSPEEFKQLTSRLKLNVKPLLELFKDRYVDFLTQQTYPHLFTDEVKANSGNYLYNCALSVNSYQCRNSKRIVNSFGCLDCSNSADLVFCNDVDNSYSLLACRDCENCAGSAYCNDCEEVIYSLHCSSSSNLLFCYGLNNKEFCIFNKQYSKREYLTLKKKIEQELINIDFNFAFLTPDLSDFEYNNSAANDFMPLSKVPAQLMGFIWDDEADQMKFSSFGNDDSKNTEEILMITDRELQPLAELEFLCPLSGEVFQYSLKELEFYKRNFLPLPGVSPYMRYIERLRKLTPFALHESIDPVSSKVVQTAFTSKFKQNIVHFDIWKKMIKQPKQK
ncbi:MAG: hypothetical protein KBC84_09600 [Proteobacteria bacterium]|nr:hypothetical protein [Pseudomonadota bacterium]